jgi:tRNA(Ile)-lysidine synthase
MSIFWIAYSGGLDSTVLLHIAATTWPSEGKAIQAIHVHHGLSKHADHWTTHCQQVAQRLNIPLVIKRVQSQPKKGDSVEAWARAQRRAAFAEVMQAGDVIVTAQHADDQAETVLLQMLRGAGVEGLSAMAEWSDFANGQQWRPFLKRSKAELLAYATQHQLSWIEDDSNEDERFDRNFLRQQIMPLLKQRWPAVNETFGRVADNCADAAESIKHSLATLDYTQPFLLTPTLDIYALRAWVQANTTVMPTRLQLDELQKNMIHACVDANPSMIFGDYTVRRYRDHLYAVKIEATHAHFCIAWDGEQPLFVPSQALPLTKVLLQQQGLEVDQLDWSTVVVRFRQGSERCKPKGRGHSQTLKKLLQEYDVPPWQRDYLPLIFSKDHLVMVVGVFVCEDFAR